MPKATFVAGWANGAPDLPPMVDPDGGLQLSHEDGDGFSILSAQHEETCVVMVKTSQAVIDAMKQDAKYVHIEDIVEVSNA